MRDAVQRDEVHVVLNRRNQRPRAQRAWQAHRNVLAFEMGIEAAFFFISFEKT